MLLLFTFLRLKLLSFILDSVLFDTTAAFGFDAGFFFETFAFEGDLVVEGFFLSLLLLLLPGA